MGRISGRYLDGATAAATPATLTVGPGPRLAVDAVAVSFSAPLADVEISARLARVPRRIRFADGAVFETDDNDGVDLALAAAGKAGEGGLVHWLESRWNVAVVALVLVAALSVGFVRYGIPAIAGWAANAMPAGADRVITAGSLELLDDVFFQPSALPEPRQAALRERFAAMVADIDDGHDYVLEFRASEALGANALALPAGTIVMTDDLVALATHDDELVAVLAHEIGHVRGRHSLQQLLRSAGIAALFFGLYGDVGSVSSIASAVPALVEAGYSREFELEADAFARQWLAVRGIPAQRFDAILCRITASHGEDRPGVTDYLASHPPTDERARCVPTRPPEKPEA